MATYTHRLTGHLIVVVLLLTSFGFLIVDINKPFWGHHDWNGVVYSNVARNYLRYGYLKTKLGQVNSNDFQEQSSFSYITHYPPLLPILLSFSFYLFDEDEAQARLVIVVFSIVFVFFIYQIGREIHSRLMGIFAAISLSLTPIFLYFGKLPVHDTVIPAISTVGFWTYIRYLKTRNSKYYALLIITLTIGGFINWSAFYFVGALLYLQIADPKARIIRNKILILIPASFIIFLIYVIHVHLLAQQSASKVFDNVLVRINPYLTVDLYGFTLFKYVKQELLFLKIYYTLPAFLGSVLFIISFLWNLMKKNLTESQILISSLFIYGIIQLVVFVQLSFIHDYMIYYLAPFMVLSFSYITFKLFKNFRHNFIFLLILITMSLYMVTSQFQFTDTLLATSMNKRGYDAGNLIRSETVSGEKTFIGSNSYKEFQEVFVGYYSDRVVSYGEILPLDFEKTFKLIIRPKDHDALDINSKQLLEGKYTRFEDDNFIWYRL